MGRRRRRAVRIPQKRLPSVFLCPKCGKKAINVVFKEERQKASIVCGNCGLRDEFPTKKTIQEIDVYCEFTDKFYSNRTRA